MEQNMNKLIGVAVLAPFLFATESAWPQGMLLVFAADKVVKKYQTATCEELKAMKADPPSEKEEMGVDYLRNDSQARKYFVDKVAAPVLNKMFECGMIP
jgi:hypothetical protein